MPNWCANRLTVTGVPKRLGLFIEAAAGQDGYDASVPLCFERLLPTPEFAAGSGPGDQGSRISDWRTEHWGTKWQPNESTFLVDRDGADGTFRLSFLTAWKPPVPLVDELAGRFSDLDFSLVYSESDGGWFAGYAAWANGALADEVEVTESHDAIALLAEHRWESELTDWVEAAPD